MKVQYALLAAVASLAVAATAHATGFTAYNDCQSSTSGNPANTTLIGYGDAAATTSGLLKDFNTGTVQAATATIVLSNTTNTAGDGSVTEFTAGTDAANMFGGKVVDTGKVIYYGNSGWYVDLLFTNLTPGSTYDFATTVDRGTGGTIAAPGYYSDRWTVITLSDVAASTYASSAGAFQVSSTATSIQCYNTINGQIAQWSGISPGTDGDFAVRFTYATDPSQFPSGASQNTTRGYGPAMFMLQETSGSVPEPTTLSLLALAGLPLLARRRRA